MSGVEETSDTNRASHNIVDKKMTDWNERVANRYAALIEDDKDECDEALPSTPTPTQEGRMYVNMSMAKGTMPDEDDQASVRTTHSADTVKRSNTMPSRVMTRGRAWNVIKQRNWVQ